ncbi:class I SAM-dependent methyltransferase [Actinoplanes derwentensis]|uniref:class I SAM-dependent methyltransferase n=1 Tax=Actinoplanes derwentensis TaxID=113562 RepID=UPI001E470AD0|nr:class I SAM-dependent methyltransferase [Actinoplanes derwentensis]
MLLDDGKLHASSVVANNAMNRERQLTGVNSYAKELGFDPLTRLTEPGSAWLDLCCGSGRALTQAAARRADVTLVGVDLVAPPATTGVRFVEAPVGDWTPDRAFDLITCVHGLHYIGDKLGVLTRVLKWLTPTGTFVADLDLASVRAENARGLPALLRAADIGYDTRRRRITCTGPRDLRLPFRYLGADDKAGPNYTGQPAVNSYYENGLTLPII